MPNARLERTRAAYRQKQRTLYEQYLQGTIGAAAGWDWYPSPPTRLERVRNWFMRVRHAARRTPATHWCGTDLGGPPPCPFTPEPDLALRPDAFTKLFQPDVREYATPDPAPRLDIVTGTGRYFPDEAGRQREALARLASSPLDDAMSCRILNP